MHLLLFFFIGVALADSRIAELEQCFTKSGHYLDRAKSDIDGNYDKDPWYQRHIQLAKQCNVIRDKIKKDGAKLVPCYIQGDRSFKCKPEYGAR